MVSLEFFDVITKDAAEINNSTAMPPKAPLRSPTTTSANVDLTILTTTGTTPDISWFLVHPGMYHSLFYFIDTLRTVHMH